GTLYLVVARRSDPKSGDGKSARSGAGALYRSRDGAEHWERVGLPENVSGPVGLTLDPRDNRRMYLSAWGEERADIDVGGGVFLTTDAGATWKRIRGYTFKWGHRVVPDPADPTMIYITIFGGSVWHGPAQPGREVPEDIPDPVPVAH